MSKHLTHLIADVETGNGDVSRSSVMIHNSREDGRALSAKKEKKKKRNH